MNNLTFNIARLRDGQLMNTQCCTSTLATDNTQQTFWVITSGLGNPRHRFSVINIQGPHWLSGGAGHSEHSHSRTTWTVESSGEALDMLWTQQLLAGPHQAQSEELTFPEDRIPKAILLSREQFSCQFCDFQSITLCSPLHCTPAEVLCLTNVWAMAHVASKFLPRMAPESRT